MVVEEIIGGGALIIYRFWDGFNRHNTFNTTHSIQSIKAS
jgi:hypothetical protein